MCIDIVEVWFGIAHWQILSIFDRVMCPHHDNGRVLSFHILISFMEFDFNVLIKETFLAHLDKVQEEPLHYRQGRCWCRPHLR